MTTFKGLPFAAPPVGPLRFRPPQGTWPPFDPARGNVEVFTPGGAPTSPPTTGAGCGRRWR